MALELSKYSEKFLYYFFKECEIEDFPYLYLNTLITWIVRAHIITLQPFLLRELIEL